MFCAHCSCFCLATFCEVCAKELSTPLLRTRILDDGFKVYYFYRYEVIRPLIYSKHHLGGGFIFKNLANFTFPHFKKYFNVEEKINIIPLDDNPAFSFSHTAILARALKSKYLIPIYASLRSTSKVRYAGKSLAYRKANKRHFVLNKKINHPVILVDDLVTSGLSLQEAKACLNKHGIRVLFAIVLANAAQC